MKHKTVLFTLLTLLLSTFGHGQMLTKSTVKFPDNASGKRGAAFINFLTSETPDALETFVQTHVLKGKEPMEKKISSFNMIRNFFENSALRKVIKVAKNKLVFIIETPGKGLARVSIDLNVPTGRRIGTVDFNKLPDNALNKKTSKKLSDAELRDAIEILIKDLNKKDKFSGSVLVAKNGKPIVSTIIGLSDRKQKTPNKIDTKFNLGSINKLFTMLAIGILADDGKLNISDTIGTHLKDYPNKQAREKVTIEQLLSMTSGIGDIFGAKYEATPKSKLRTINAYFPLFASKPLLFEPGTNRKYSNGGFLVLGAIIEKVSGKTYYEFVRERIYKPIGMNDTGSYEFDAKVPNLAEGYNYSKTEQKLVNNLPTRPARGSSGGGGYSTAPDMLKFSNAIESGSFAPPNSLKNVGSRSVNRLASGTLRFGGGAPGINASIRNKVAGKYTVIVLSNYDPPSASIVSKQIRDWLQ